MSFKVSVPCSTMLLGEHAVLYGHSSVVCALDYRLQVELKPREDTIINIFSDQFGEYTTDIGKVCAEKPFQFVLTAIKFWQPHLSCGFDLFIRSKILTNVGLGTSAAITVAVIAVLMKFLENRIDVESVYRGAATVINSVQGSGSFADVAASIFGGVISYRKKPLYIEPLFYFPEIWLIYLGYKTPTAEVIKKVAEARNKNPKLYDKLFSKIGGCVDLGTQALLTEDWMTLGKIFSAHQKLQQELGVSDASSTEIISALSSIKTVLGAKISGSGLGDCIIALGEIPPHYFPMNKQQKTKEIKQIKAVITKTGLNDESR